MTLSELIEQLQDLQNEVGEDVDPEVLLAHQPSWPLQFTVSHTVLWSKTDDEPIVYLAEGTHPTDDPYAPNVWRNHG